MAFQVLLAVPDPAVSDQAAAMLEESDDLHLAVRVTSGNAVAPVLTDTGIDVIVLHERLGPVPALDLARDLNRRFPAVSLILLVEDQTPELLRAAMSAGIRATITVPLALEEFTGALLAAGEWSQAVRDRMATGDEPAVTPAGMMLVLAGGKGGVGTTTLATLLARHLAGVRDIGSVCLVDLDLQTGDVRALLDITHRRSIADLVGVADELTTRHLDESLFPHASGLRILLPPLEGELAEDVDATAARRILGGLRARFDLVLVDVGAVMTDASATAIEMADHLLVVTTTDVPSLRGTNRLLAMLDRLAIRRDGIRALVNQVSRDSEVQPDLCARVLDVPVLGTSVPARFRELESAVNTGDLGRVGDDVSRAVAAVADELERLGEAPAAREVGEPPSETEIEDRVAAGQWGQTTAEFLAALPLLVLALLIAWQFVLVGWTYVMTQHAAREGAHQLAISEAPDADGDGIPDDVAATVRRRLPDGWLDGLDLTLAGTSVRVEVDVPVVVPRLGRLITVSSTAGAVPE